MCEYSKCCYKVAVEIRKLLFNEASSCVQGAMAGEPIECFAFALEWIKKQKGLPYHNELFKSLNTVEPI